MITMKCPHCFTLVQLNNLKAFRLPTPQFNVNHEYYVIQVGTCPNCNDITVILLQGSDDAQSIREMTFVERTKTVLYPTNTPRSIADGVPDPYKSEYIQASKVAELSPMASAAICRRILQNILHNHFKIKDRDLSKEIDIFINTISAPIQLKEDIDAIRHIGNFAAHPLKSQSTGQIIEVEPGEVEWLLDTLEALFDFAFIQPKQAEIRRLKLNEKLKDAGKPPMK